MLAGSCKLPYILNKQNALSEECCSKLNYISFQTKVTIAYKWLLYNWNLAASGTLSSERTLFLLNRLYRRLNLKFAQHKLALRCCWWMFYGKIVQAQHSQHEESSPSRLSHLQCNQSKRRLMGVQACLLAAFQMPTSVTVSDHPFQVALLPVQAIDEGLHWPQCILCRASSTVVNSAMNRQYSTVYQYCNHEVSDTQQYTASWTLQNTHKSASAACMTLKRYFDRCTPQLRQWTMGH